jgi:hypothetical protein
MPHQFDLHSALLECLNDEESVAYLSSVQPLLAPTPNPSHGGRGITGGSYNEVSFKRFDIYFYSQVTVEALPEQLLKEEWLLDFSMNVLKLLVTFKSVGI